jgi:hypothetical protein
MTMNSSGPISLGGTIEGQSIAIQNGGTGSSTISLDDTAVRTLAGVPSGQIVMPDDFWGKGAPLPPILLANVNLRSYALAEGWDGVSAYTATFNSRTYVYSTSTGNAALTINGAWPNGVTVINNGFIQGKGGNGGTAFDGSGAAGGPAISTSVSFNLQNNSFVGGGGGGGGAGRGNAGGAGGGGGGAGGGNGGGARYNGTGSGGTGGNPAQTGTNGGNRGNNNFGGAGGGGIMPGSAAGSNAGGQAGGGGGNGFGSTSGGVGGGGGSAGQTVTGLNCQAGGGGGGWGARGGDSNSNAGAQGGRGGAGGNAIQLNGNTVNLTGSGTIYGAVS